MMVLSLNSKTGYSTNLPTEHTCERNCPFYSDKSCYGMRGRFVFGAVKKANEAKFTLYKANPELYFDVLKAEIVFYNISFLRVNGVGDIPDLQYAEMLSALAFDMPGVMFWVSTRKKAICEKVEWPENVVIRYSEGIEGTHTSNVTEDKAQVTCLATIKVSGIKTCRECGYLCWNKGIKNITFLKH